MDRYNRFANAWRTIGVSSKVKWQQSSALDRFNSILLRSFIERHPDEAAALIQEAGLKLGMEDGRKICDNLGIASKTTRSCLMPLEAISLLVGVDSAVLQSKNPSHQTLRIECCVFEKMMGNVSPGLRQKACESYSAGLVRAVSPDAELKISKCKCAGGKYCDFVVTLR